MGYEPTLRGEDMLRRPDTEHTYSVTTVVKSYVAAKSHDEAKDLAADRLCSGWLPGVTITEVNSQAMTLAERSAGVTAAIEADQRPGCA